MPHPFDQLVALESPWIRLDCAALHLARDAYPDVGIVSYLQQLDELSEQVAAHRPGLSAAQRYQAMQAALVEDFGLTGEDGDYYDPRNAYLNTVLDRRRGMPIIVATVWLEVARRLKWPVQGIAFPGHFLIRFDDPEHYLIVDPFHGGRTLSPQDCRKILAHCFDGRVRFKKRFLAPVDTRVILARMLNNLRSIYLAAQNWAALECVLARLVALEPDEGRHIQELAALRYRIGDVRKAHAHLAHYVRTRPQAKDVPLVQRRLDHLEAAIAALN